MTPIFEKFLLLRIFIEPCIERWWGARLINPIERFSVRNYRARAVTRYRFAATQHHHAYQQEVRQEPQPQLYKE